MIELLSPAGDMESLKAAILYGADAVYVGGNGFGLRANAGFSMDELHGAVQYAHSQGKCIYLTCNIVANNADIAAFPDFIREADAMGVDAVIVSDLGLRNMAQAYAPGLEIHISTQAGVMNYCTAELLHALGAKRVILARELSLAEIREIRAKTPPELELEAFVHGAMCMAFSGRCLISSYLANRDANRGQCAQPCRWNYRMLPNKTSGVTVQSQQALVIEETRPNEYFPIFEEENGTYLFNSKDLCMIEHISELAEAGITSFKIEGRAKTAYYTAVVTNAYRAAIDAFERGEPTPEWALCEVACVSHRPYSTGFYLGAAEQNYEQSGYIRNCDFVGVVEGYSDGFIQLTQRNYFTAEDSLEVIAPATPPQKLFITEMYNEKNERITVANHAVERLR
ncbi:MAG: U32 family peptidase, partial [Oscillospiraceae bacterium]|nr:U32 family peptidase [Oscillospiraceae bacterium]